MQDAAGAGAGAAGTKLLPRGVLVFLLERSTRGTYMQVVCDTLLKHSLDTLLRCFESASVV